MVNVVHLRKLTIGVLGLGKTGLGVLSFLKQHDLHAVAWDDNADQRKKATDAGFPLWAEDYRVDLLIASPGIDIHKHPKAKAAMQIIGDIDLLATLRPDARLIGITGTNGKSTTTALLTHILTHAGLPATMGGNIGIPALDLINQFDKSIFVLELSSYQLDLYSSRPFSAAAILNITPDHLERHGTMDLYATAKKKILRDCPFAVVGTTDPYCLELAQKPGILGLETPSPRQDLPPCLRGSHNAQNIAVAGAIALHFGVTESQLEEALQTYPGLPHRMEPVGQTDQLLFINDSKATNAEATHFALRSFDTIYWLCGGLAKSGGVKVLKEDMCQVKKGYFYGKDGAHLAQDLPDLPHSIHETLDQAFAAALKDAKEGVILLSPACASFDQFKNFEERGTYFRGLVEKHLKDNP